MLHISPGVLQYRPSLHRLLHPAKLSLLQAFCWRAGLIHAYQAYQEPTGVRYPPCKDQVVATAAVELVQQHMLVDFAGTRISDVPLPHDQAPSAFRHTTNTSFQVLFEFRRDHASSQCYQDVLRRFLRKL